MVKYDYHTICRRPIIQSESLTGDHKQPAFLPKSTETLALLKATFKLKLVLIPTVPVKRRLRNEPRPVLGFIERKRKL